MQEPLRRPSDSCGHYLCAVLLCIIREDLLLSWIEPPMISVRRFLVKLSIGDSPERYSTFFFAIAFTRLTWRKRITFRALRDFLSYRSTPLLLANYSMLQVAAYCLAGRMFDKLPLT